MNPSPIPTRPPWIGRQRRRKAETKAERLERVAADMRARRTQAQKSARERWERVRVNPQEHQMTLDATASIERQESRQGADIWPSRALSERAK